MMNLTKNVHNAWLVILCFSLFLSVVVLIDRAKVDISRAHTALQQQKLLLHTAQQNLENLETLSELKRNDLIVFTENLADEATAKKDLFESGVMLHDEKRLLEKQWDIMSTSILVDEERMRISILKSQEPVESFMLSSAPIMLGVVQSSSVYNYPNIIRITSKERFAHPERGKAETIDGILKWTPPQVGTSVRANALGEYVIFTNSPVIFHGPPKNPVDHEAYQHLCLNLPQETAKNIYQKTFIGTKITLIITQSAKDNEGSDASGLEP